MHFNIWVFSMLATVHTTQIPQMSYIYITPKPGLFGLSYEANWGKKDFLGFVKAVKGMNLSIMCVK